TGEFIRMTDARRFDLDEHFASARTIEIDSRDFQWFARGVCNCSLRFYSSNPQTRNARLNSAQLLIGEIAQLRWRLISRAACMHDSLRPKSGGQIAAFIHQRNVVADENLVDTLAVR